MATLVSQTWKVRWIYFCIFFAILILLLTSGGKPMWISDKQISTFNRRSTALQGHNSSNPEIAFINSTNISEDKYNGWKESTRDKESEESSTMRVWQQMALTVEGSQNVESASATKSQQKWKRNKILGSTNTSVNVKDIVTTTGTNLEIYFQNRSDTSKVHSDLNIASFCNQSIVCNKHFGANSDIFLDVGRGNMSVTNDTLFDSTDYNCSCQNEESVDHQDDRTGYGKPVGRPSLSINNGILTKDEHEGYIQIIKSIKWALNIIDLVMVSLAILTFASTKASSSSTTFILALNGFEFMAAFLAIVGYSLKEGLAEGKFDYLMYTKWASLYVTAVCRRVVYILNMFMSGQRLLVITFPFLARTTLRNRINVVIIIVIVVITFGSHVYIPLSYTIIKRTNRIYSLVPSSVYKSNQDQFEMASIASKFLFAFFPLIIGLFASLIMLVYLKQLGKNSRALRAVQISPRHNRKDRQVTLMILVSSLTFTLLCLPANTHLLVTTYTQDYGFYKTDHYLFLVVHEALLGLLTLGDITNFLSYLILSSAFREQLLTALTPLRLLLGHSKHVNKGSPRSSLPTSDTGKG